MILTDPSGLDRIELTVEGGWSVPTDLGLQAMLEATIILGQDGGADPDYIARAAQEAVERFGLKIIEEDPPDNDPADDVIVF